MRQTVLLIAILAAHQLDAAGANERVLPEPDLTTVRSAIAPAPMHVTTIVIDGNTVLSDSEIASVTRSYVGRPLGDADLQALRDALSLLYVANGYLNSGVYVPDQRVTDGRLRLQAVEGRLNEIRVNGEPRLHPAYVVDRLQRDLSSPLNITQLRDAIQLLQRDPLIRRIDAHLEPGALRGSSVLQVSLEEAPPRSVFMRLDNHRSEAVGAERATIGFSHQNLLGRADTLAFDFGVSDGTNVGSLRYATPLSANDTKVRFYYVRDTADVVETPFDALDIETETDSYGFGVDIPLRRSLSRSFGVTVGMELKRSESELLGVPFSLSPGALDGESRVSVAILGVDWLSRADDQVIALRGTLRNGFDIFGATNPERSLFDPSSTDGTFTTFLGQGQIVRRINDAWQLSARATFQLSADPLLAFEKLAIGGVNTVRGYRENLLVRDNGFAASIELSWRPFADHSATIANSLTIGPFVDYGRSWDEEDVDLTSTARDTDDADYLVGLGVGLRWQPVRGFSFDVSWADDVDTSFKDGNDPREGNGDHGLQDDGIHFALSYRASF